MSSLRRTMAAGFTLSQSVTLDQVQEAEVPQQLLLSVDQYFSMHPALEVSAAVEKKIRNGMTCVLPQTPEGTYRVYSADGSFLAVSRLEHGKLQTIKSFFEV